MKREDLSVLIRVNPRLRAIFSHVPVRASPILLGLPVLGDVRKVETLKGEIVGYVGEGARQVSNCRTRIDYPLIGHVE